MDREVSFISPAGSRKRKAAEDVDASQYDLSEVARVVSFGKLSAVLESKSGERAKVPKAVALRFLKESGQTFLPKGCKKVEACYGPNDIKNVLFKYATVSYVKLKTGTKVYVPREVGDEFEELAGKFKSMSGSGRLSVEYLGRGVDQPWNDRTVHDVLVSDILKVVKCGKKTGRVMLTDFTTVIVSRGKIEEFQKGELEEGEKILASLGIQFKKA